MHLGAGDNNGGVGTNATVTQEVSYFPKRGTGLKVPVEYPFESTDAEVQVTCHCRETFRRRGCRCREDIKAVLRPRQPTLPYPGAGDVLLVAFKS